LRDHRKSVAREPKRHFATVYCRIAKGSHTLDIGRPRPPSIAGGAGARSDHFTSGNVSAGKNDAARLLASPLIGYLRLQARRQVAEHRFRNGIIRKQMQNLAIETGRGGKLALFEAA
jgi:hypothetical protein